MTLLEVLLALDQFSLPVLLVAEGAHQLRVRGAGEVRLQCSSGGVHLIVLPPALLYSVDPGLDTSVMV